MKRSLLLTLGGLALAGCLIARATRRSCSFANKIVLITGGSRGLGLLLARIFCTEGARVALLARDPDELARAREELRQRGGEVLTISCDLLERAQSDMPPSKRSSIISAASMSSSTTQESLKSVRSSTCSAKISSAR